MKYEFHVGDYIACSINGKIDIGYVREYNGTIFSGIHCFVFQWDDGTQSGWSGNIQELPHNFVRIGQYDFTKKDEGKIEPLCEEYIKFSPIYKTTTTGNDLEWCGIDIGVVGKKINELVEAVNRLEEKVNGN